MPNRSSKPVQTVENLASLLSRSRRRFGELLREVCEASGLTQGKLSREAKAERQRLIEVGYLNSDDLIGSMEQPTISKVMAGLQDPTYFQVFIWLRAIRSHYESPRFAKICKKLEIPVPRFSSQLEHQLWHLAMFVPPDDLLEAYDGSFENKEVKLLEDSPSLIDHKEARWGSTTPNVKNTDAIPALSNVASLREKAGPSKTATTQKSMPV